MTAGADEGDRETANDGNKSNSENVYVFFAAVIRNHVYVLFYFGE